MSALKLNPLSQKILLLLYAGIAFGFSYMPRHHWRIIKGVAGEWRRINKEKLQEEIRKLYKSKIVEKKENPDGTITLVLTDKGKLRALTYKFQEMKIEKRDWDGKWRIVVFDIPEKIRKGRDALRSKLKELGFYELQKSVFIFPYNCEKEINFIIEFFDLRKYVRCGTLNAIDNELHLKKIFELNKN